MSNENENENENEKTEKRMTMKMKIMEKKTDWRKNNHTQEKAKLVELKYPGN